MTLIETEFVVQHFYTVKPNEQAIDEKLARTHYSPPEWKEELSQRFHSIYRSIMANEKALLAILEYATMFYHDLEICESNEFILNSYYEDEGSGIKDAFLRVANCLSAEDKTWLEENVDNEDLQTILLPCFLPHKWNLNIVEHRHNRKEKEQA